MAILRVAAAVLALGACYSPELRDCAVSCATTADCGPGQLCGAVRWCASPALAGLCEPDESGMRIDAGATDALPSTVDAQSIDAAPATVNLVVSIGGKGTVSIAAVGSCSDTSPGHQCTFAVLPGVPRTLVATPGNDFEFEQWMQGCAGQSSTCTLTPTAPTTTVQAKFKHE